MFLPENTGIFSETVYKKNMITVRVPFKNVLIYLGFFTVFILLGKPLSSTSSVERLIISQINNYIFTPGLWNNLVPHRAIKTVTSVSSLIFKIKHHLLFFLKMRENKTINISH